MSQWVIDTSPLIFLAKLGHLSLLQRGADALFVPPAVVQEVRAKPDMATQIIEDALNTWLPVRSITHREAVKRLLGSLDRGEAEVIVLARELQADHVIMDDLAARRFARRIGLAPIGTLGLLLAGYLRGEIPSIKMEIERLESLGFRATPALVTAILEQADEAK